jgi:small subunit ribosomal protein S6
VNVNYETMLALNPNLEDETITSFINGLKELVIREGGTVIREKELGKKKFAYLVKKFQTGYYLLLYFSSPPGAVTEMERTLKLNEDVLRFLTVKLDEKEFKHTMAALEDEAPAVKEE